MVILLVTSGVFVAGVGSVAADDSEENGAGQAEIEQELAQLQMEMQMIQDQMEAGSVVQGEPDLDLRVPNPYVQPGETNEVNVQVINDGELDRGPADAREAVTTARNVEIEADADDTPLTVRGGTVPVGPVSETQPREAPIAIDVPDDVEAGTYTIDADVSYTYTERIGSSNVWEESETDSISFDVEVDDDARFEIVDVRTDAQIGDTGVLEADVKNTGNETATDVNVALESMSSGLMFGSMEHEATAMQDSARIDELEANETATVIYDVSVMPDTSERQYMLDGTVTFKTPDGHDRIDESPMAGVIPQPEQQFGVGNIESDLHVGEDGYLYGTVTNEGPSKAENVVVTFTEESPTLIPIERSIAVGSLEPGEDEAFRLPLSVSGEAEAVDRVIDLGVQYRNADFDQRMYEDIEVMTHVNEQRDEFIVDVADREIAAGDDRTLEVDVTNNLDETVTDIEANLFADDPLNSDDNDAFVEELEPGETVTLVFDLDADGGATEKTYPISIDFRYDDASGTSQLSDTTRIAIDVVESGGSFPVGLISVLTLTGLGAGAYVFQRR